MLNKPWAVILIGVLVACSSESPVDPGAADAGPSEGCVPASDIVAGTPIEAAAETWTWIPFPDSSCLNDTPAGLGVNLNPDSPNLMVFFEAGGACFNEITCTAATAHTDGFDESTLRDVTTNLGSEDIMDRSDTDNPVADWSYVFVPYCTGDVHAGTNPNGVGGRTQVGHQNVRAYLSRLLATFPDPETVLVTGTSAGAFGATFNYDLIARTFPCAAVHLLNDAGTLLPDDYLRPCLQQRWRDAWQFDQALPTDCEGCSNAMGGGLANVLRTLSRRYSNRRFGLISSLEDSVLRQFFGFGYSASCDTAEPMPASDFEAGVFQLRDELLVEEPNFRTFLQPGDEHTLLLGDLSEPAASGVGLREWIGQLLDGDAAWSHVGPEP